MSEKIGAGLEIVGALLCLVFVAYVVTSTYGDLAKPDLPPTSAQVTYVIDGDTIEVTFADGERERVRLLGIDAAEIDWESMEAECFGFEAKEYLTERIKDKQILLVGDESQPAYDSYNRRLSFILLDEEESQENVNVNLVEEGYARQMIVGTPTLYQPELIAAEFEAREEERGRWGACE